MEQQAFGMVGCTGNRAVRDLRERRHDQFTSWEYRYFLRLLRFFEGGQAYLVGGGTGLLLLARKHCNSAPRQPERNAKYQFDRKA